MIKTIFLYSTVRNSHYIFKKQRETKFFLFSTPRGYKTLKILCKCRVNNPRMNEKGLPRKFLPPSSGEKSQFMFSTPWDYQTLKT